MIDENRQICYEKQLQELSDEELKHKLNELEQVIISNDVQICEIIMESKK